MSPYEVIRVLVVDDERPIREAYCELLASDQTAKASEAERLRNRLFNRESGEPPSQAAFEVYTAHQAEEGVEAVRAKLDSGQRFDVVFLDMRMPPGPDGAWAASAIRALDASVDIVIVTAYSDVDPAVLSSRIPPAEKLFYLQKPFHAHELRQLALALGRKAHAETEIRRLAYFDTLTGLPNRDQLRDQLARAIGLAARHERKLAVVFIDLDNFKRINDTLGHSIGDEVLRATATRFRDAVRDSDAVGRMAGSIARMGGDEFVLLLPEIANAADAGVVADRIARSLAAPLAVRGHELYLAPSLGISVYPDDAADVETLLRNADLAMYFAKRNSRGTFQFYDAAMNATALQRLTLENELRGAMERGELSLHYQPQIDLRSGCISGMEALLRWENQALGSVPPLEFIPVAEETGLIVPIGDWVLRHACMQAKAWLAAGLPVPRMAVNVSAVQLAQPDFLERVAHALEQSGLEAGLLELELTESVLVANLERAQLVLEALKSLGVQIAIDDFGVGYANMTYLKTLAIDRLKMDRSFVNGIDANGRDRAISAAIISMAQSMDLRVTAEGVEDDGQLDVLEGQGCDDVQGYFVARPMGAAKAEVYLRSFDRVRPTEKESS
jgi:diguanylate cyclase (GGDEF)-like protein